MFRNILFTISLSGTAVFFLYIILYPLLRRYVPVRWRYYALCMCIFFYLFPLPLLKRDYLPMLLYFLPFLKEIYMPSKVSYTAADIAFLITSYDDGRIRLTPRIHNMRRLIAFCSIVALLLMLGIFHHYQKAKRTHMAVAVEPVPPEWQRLFEDARAEMKVSKRVRLLCSPCCNSPITWGVLSPVILLPIPSDDMTEEAVRLMLKHELVHIRYHHLYIKYIGLLVRAVHWFNPVVYLWFRELCNVSEMMCDEIVIKDIEPERRRQYCHMILNYATMETPHPQLPFSARLTGDAVVLKRRILEMKYKKRKAWLLMFPFTLTLAISGTLTAFAYIPPIVLCDVPSEQYGEPGEIIAIREVEDRVDNTACLPYPWYYADSEGNICPLPEPADSSCTCTHSCMIPVTVTRHVSDGTGSCNITDTQEQKCRDCSMRKYDTQTQVIHYSKCPHTLLQQAE